MYDFLEVAFDDLRAERRFEWIPTVALQLEQRQITDEFQGRFMHELIKDFYEQPELVASLPKVRLTVLEVLHRMHDCFAASQSLERRLQRLAYYYASFKKKKYIRIETEAGKVARQTQYKDAYFVLTPLGIETFLNLDPYPISLHSKQSSDSLLSPLTSTPHLVSMDLDFVSSHLSDVFSRIEPHLKARYERHYEQFLHHLYELLPLSMTEQHQRLHSYRGGEFEVLIKQLLVNDGWNTPYRLRYDKHLLPSYFEQVIANRLHQDRETFVTKLTQKLATLVKGRSFTLEISLSSSLEVHLNVNLSERARFELHTQFVEHTNQYGTYFIRQVSKFRHVYDWEGQSIKNPSYEKIRQIF